MLVVMNIIPAARIPSRAQSRIAGSLSKPPARVVQFLSTFKRNPLRIFPVANAAPARQTRHSGCSVILQTLAWPNPWVVPAILSCCSRSEHDNRNITATYPYPYLYPYPYPYLYLSGMGETKV